MQGKEVLRITPPGVVVLRMESLLALGSAIEKKDDKVRRWLQEYLTFSILKKRSFY